MSCLTRLPARDGMDSGSGSPTLQVIAEMVMAVLRDIDGQYVVSARLVIMKASEAASRNLSTAS
ncbi:hypothetical protein GSI_12183 [Ganoderma sinense ZZ0214-1]|uniref:Uncharacterized protein n=1 Tax=Ganoderma sinense ZZ0214-1 TaxID=1077348 RepID=A0A2G8RY34_9APHY|nr:hypothetical protein GSI_12183 [Ganoderma sinense ZZ0214-1]